MSVFHTCRDCFAREECGGWTTQGEEPIFTCFDVHSAALIAQRTTKAVIGEPARVKNKRLFIDPKRRRDFWQRLAEVRYFDPLHPNTFVPAELASFPDYLTLIQGGVCFHRPLAIDHAALNLIEIFHGDRGRGLGFGQRELTADSLRREWGLAPSASILLSGVAGDPELERLWANHRAVDLARQVAGLRVSAVTAPNFTFWKDAPRLENLVNRRRMFRVAEAFTESGIAVIPHINSTNLRDWDWTLNFLKEHPELHHVCMEFRTGNRIKEVRQRKIGELKQLGDRLQRDLIPLVVGNTEAAHEMRAHFQRVIAIDSMPALKTVRRQRAIEGTRKNLTWRTEPVGPGICMASLFEENFTAHSRFVRARIAQPMEIPVDNAVPVAPRKTSRASNRSSQGELPLEAA